MAAANDDDINLVGKAWCSKWTQKETRARRSQGEADFTGYPVY